MSISIATRGIIAGLGGAVVVSGTVGDPVDIPDIFMIGDANVAAVRASYDDEADPSEALPPWNYEEYIPNKRSSIEHLPSNTRVTFPTPRNLDE